MRSLFQVKGYSQLDDADDPVPPPSLSWRNVKESVLVTSKLFTRR
jgi:hypothetical protein